MADKPANVSCGDCRYWTPALGRDRAGGECHRFPPVPNPDAAMAGKDLWPLTTANQWCGEFNAPMPCEAS